jgi:hypothetical protein
MSEPGSLYEALVAAEQHDQACCTYWVRWRPRHRLRSFHHRLWLCTCGQAWRTERGPYEKTTWLWRRWSS